MCTFVDDATKGSNEYNYRGTMVNPICPYTSSPYSFLVMYEFITLSFAP